MPTPPLGDDVLQAAVDLRAQHPTLMAAARAANISENAFRNRIRLAAKAGLMGTAPVLPGFMIKSVSSQLGPDGALEREWVRQSHQPGDTFEVPAGHQVKGVSALVGADGQTIQQWVKTKKGLDPLALVDAIKTAFADFTGRAPLAPAPVTVDDDLLTLWPLPDLHMGLYAWAEETQTNWNLNTAKTTIQKAMSRLAASTPSTGTAVVLGGGDQLHADNMENRTAQSGNALDVDGRFAKVLLTTCHLFVHITALALTKHNRVIVRILQGNHDPHASIALSYFLLAWFRDDPRVEVDVSPSLFWWRRFGKVLLGATHGHMAKPNEMPGIMAERRAQDWGKTVHRFCHTFHVHHSSKTMSEGGGAITETHQTPAPKDSWHFSMGYLSGRSLQSIVYHREHGEIARNRVAIV